MRNCKHTRNCLLGLYFEMILPHPALFLYFLSYIQVDPVIVQNWNTFCKSLY